MTCSMRLPRVPWPAVGLSAIGLSALVILGACRQPGDLTETPRPASRPSLQLQLRPVTADSAALVLTLEGADPAAPIGSLTAEVALSPDAGWRLTGCDGAQGVPLVACHAAAPGVRLAAAWTAGTHDGELVTLAFTRSAGASVTAAPLGEAQLRVTQVHTVSGRPVGESLDVREGVRR